VNGTSTSPSPEDLTLLSEVLRDVSRRRLSPDEAQDFVQSAHLKLLERQYDVFGRFTGGSSLRTYLTVVVIRLLLDWRNSTYGKWRPSAAAVRLGPEVQGLPRQRRRPRPDVRRAAVRGPRRRVRPDRHA